MRSIAIIASLALASALSAATLSNPRRLATAFEFSLTGASNAVYAIEASRDLRNWTMVATNRQLGEVRTIALSSSTPEEFYRVRLVLSRFSGALGARESVRFRGLGVRVDSFDSADPLASTDGRYDPAKARDRGNIMTSSGLTNSLDLGNAKVYGVLHVPPGAGAALGPNGSVGSTEWIQSGQLGIEPGHLAEGTTHTFIDVEPPTSDSYLTPGPGSIGGTNYTYVLSNGLYRLPELRFSSMLVTGLATLYVTGSADLGGRIVIMRTASLRLYVGGAEANIDLSGVVNESRHAEAFVYYGLPGNTNVYLTGNASVAWIFYAPAADLYFGGGGSDLLEISGIVIGRNITVNTALRLHYDERLGGIAVPAN